MTRVLYVPIFLLLPVFLLSQQKQLDSILSAQFKSNEPGISVLISKNGQTIYQKAFGSANIELNTPLQPDMVFRIGSITKQFTAIVTLQLVEKGLISLQDSIQKFIKDYPVKNYTVTIENLLTHTSGIGDYGNADTVNVYIEREDFSATRIINYFKNWPLEFKPGTRYSYSNSNYVLLAYIIQLVSKQNYHQYIKDHIIIPAGLQHTLYAEERIIVPGRVHGYTRDRGYFENTDYQTLSIGFGCGDLLSNAEDLFRWNTAVISNKLVGKQYVEKAFTPYILNNGNPAQYGYGWFIDSLYGYKCIHHEGQVSGFIALEKYFPTEDIYVVVLTNVKSGEDRTDFSAKRFRLFSDIAYLALGKTFSKEIKLNESVLKDYSGTYRLVNSNASLAISVKNGQLFCDLSNGSGKNMILSPLSETKFYLPDVLRIYTTFEFVRDKGRISKLITTQDKNYIWEKVE